MNRTEFYCFFTVLFLTISISAAYADKVIIKKVIDGSTFELHNGERIRLIGIKIARKQEKAKKAVRRILEGKEVLLEYDKQARDHDGALLAYVLVPEQTMGPVMPSEAVVVRNNRVFWFLNTHLIVEKLAVPNPIPPNLLYADFLKEVFETYQNWPANQSWKTR